MWIIQILPETFIKSIYYVNFNNYHLTFISNHYQSYLWKKMQSVSLHVEYIHPNCLFGNSYIKLPINNAHWWISSRIQIRAIYWIIGFFWTIALGENSLLFQLHLIFLNWQFNRIIFKKFMYHNQHCEKYRSFIWFPGVEIWWNLGISCNVINGSLTSSFGTLEWSRKRFEIQR